MDWIPIVLISFKLLVLGAAMFFSIKSHRDKEKEEQEEERERQARASGTGGAVPLGHGQLALLVDPARRGRETIQREAA